MLLTLKFFLAILLTETITEIVTKSEIFLPFRKKIYDLGETNRFFDWFHRLVDCGYCFSVWSGALVAILLLSDIRIVNVYIDWFLVTLALHRLSNLFHNIMDKIHGT